MLNIFSKKAKTITIETKSFIVVLHHDTKNPSQSKGTAKSRTGHFTFEFTAHTNMYWLLYSGMESTDNVDMFLTISLLALEGLSIDPEFTNDVTSAYMRYLERQDKAGAEAAANVSPEEEAAAQNLMKGAAEVAEGMKKKSKGKAAKKRTYPTAAKKAEPADAEPSVADEPNDRDNA